jgi:solute carrier family 25 (mitochondrial phosphate transporter), member 3
MDSSNDKNQQKQPFMAWSAIDDVKQKTSQSKQAVQQSYENMSSQAQAKTGQIELFSPKYYAACTFGGLLACVS